MTDLEVKMDDITRIGREPDPQDDCPIPLERLPIMREDIVRAMRAGVLDGIRKRASENLYGDEQNKNEIRADLTQIWENGYRVLMMIEELDVHGEVLE
jgi:hypothetical protein